MASVEVEHSRTSHDEKLNLLCRICGGRSKEWKQKSQPFLCENYADTISKAYNINIENDEDGVHSKTLCRKCYLRFKHIIRSGKTSESALKDIERSSVLWVGYDAGVGISSCVVCSTFQKQKKGGHHSKLFDFKPIVSPVCQSKTTDISDVSGNVHDDSSNVDGPSDNSMPSTSAFFPPTTSTPLRTTPVASSEPCPSTSAGDILLHTSDTTAKQTQRTRTFGTKPCKKRTVRGIDQISLPLNKAEEKLFTKMVKLKLAASEGKKVVECQTGGQKIMLRRIVKPRKGSSYVCTPTRKRRAREHRDLRKATSGQFEDDSIKQLATELKTTKSKSARKVLELAGHKENNITPKEMVILQNTVGFSNRRGRIVSQTLRKKGVKVPTEKEIKEFKKVSECGAVTVETKTVLEHHGPFLAPTPKDIPVVEIVNMVEYVTEKLDRLAEKVCSFSFFYHALIVLIFYQYTGKIKIIILC